ncbi:MAG: efflux RND transporter permease subunit [Sphingomonas sp.]|nr:efflux RND transporter permease subunit [Sphingomonas sp.]
MNLRRISEWSIRNPVPPIVLFIGLTLAGIISFIGMEVTDNPDIDFPAANVSIVQPGAAPEEMENQITQRVEAALRSVDGVDEINSSVNEGSSNTFVQFAIGTNTDRAVNDVRDAVAQIRGDLPAGILEPRINRVNITGDSLSFIAINTTDMTLEQLSWFVDDTVSRRLLGIEGLAEVSRYGGVDREIRVILDPDAMQAQGITAAQVNNQLRQTNLNAAGGLTEIAGTRQSVRVLGNAETAYELSQTLISIPGGNTVRLRDIAEVSDGASEQTSLARMNGQEVVVFSFNRAKGASDITVYDAAWEELNAIAEEDPRVSFTEINNSVEYTKGQYASSMQALIEGAILAVLVVFLFLRDFRATAISAIAIPLSAIPAFFFMDLMNINLNFLSLLALALVAGVLVDDAIVEIENIVRHMRMGKSAFQASIDAADEIGLAVVATTAAIVAVFLPVALMPGISGQFFKNFGYTVVLAVIMSLLVARMITPLVAAYFLRSHGEEAHGEGPMMKRYLKVLNWTLDDSKARAYKQRNPGFTGWIGSWFRDHRMTAVLGGFLTLVATVVLFATLPQQFQPDLDLDNNSVRISMPPGATLQQTQAKVAEAAQVVLAHPDVETVFERTFTNSGYVNVTLTEDRDKTSTQIERELAPRLAQISDARVNFQSQGGGGPGGSGQALTMYLGSSDPAALEQAANAIMADMAERDEFISPRVIGDDIRPEITVTPRFDLAADLGVTTAALSQTIRIATLGEIDQNSAKFSLSDRQIPISVSLSEQDRQDLDTLTNLPVPTANGGSVPLKAVADIGFGAGPTTIQRTDQMRRIAIGADLQPGLVTGDAYEIIEELPAYQAMPSNVTRLNLGAEKWQQELIQNFVIAVFSGVLLVFAVLVLLYRRFLSPFVNMGSLLLAPLGAFIMLHLFGLAVSLPVYIGLLMLLGIVAKNSILLVDFAVEMMNHGMEKNKAIYEAGHKRAQPIVMTTVAMVAGMIPIALSLHGDGSWRSPMGYTVIGGLIFSTVLTLLLVPAFFSLAIDAEKWVVRKLGGLVNPGDDRPLLPAGQRSVEDGSTGPKPLPAAE